MTGTGAKIGKVLRKPMKEWFDMAQMTASDMTRSDADACLWMRKDYPELMEALIQTGCFHGTEEEKKIAADAYLCGVYRGIQDTAFRFAQMSRRKTRKRTA